MNKIAKEIQSKKIKTTTTTTAKTTTSNAIASATTKINIDEFEIGADVIFKINKILKSAE